MSNPPKSSRLRWLILALLVVLLVGGVAVAGKYLPPEVWVAVGLEPPGGMAVACGCSPSLVTTPATSDLPPCCQARGVAAAVVGQEFPISAADVKDSLEAPFLAADAGGRVFLAWASQTGENERTLFLATSLDGGKKFDPPLAVQKSEIFASNFESNGKKVSRTIRMVPLLAVQGDHLLLGWLQSVDDNSNVKFMLAESENAGLSFSEPICVHENAAARPAFTSLAAGNQTRAASWLGMHDGNKLPFVAIASQAGEPFQPEQMIPAAEEGQGVCPCCPTSIAIAPDGAVYVAFRNIEQGKRDTFVARWSAAGGLEKAVPVLEEPTWEFDGCPHDGPSLTVDAENIHVAWMDGRTGTRRVYYGRSAAGELKFVTRPLHEAGPGTQGNAKLCLDVAGGVHAVWEETLPGMEVSVEKEEMCVEPTSEVAVDKSSSATHSHDDAADSNGRMIMYAYAPAGEDFGEPKGVRPRVGAFQTRPALVATADGVVVTFNELDEKEKRVVVTRVEIPATSPKITVTQ